MNTLNVSPEDIAEAQRVGLKVAEHIFSGARARTAVARITREELAKIAAAAYTLGLTDAL